MNLDQALKAIRSRSLSQRDKGTAFERLVRKALITHPGEFGSLRFERIIPWAEWEGSGGEPDTGIDLIGYQHGGGLAAIQCKFYAPGHAVKKGDVDGFIAKSARPEFTARILVNTGDKLTHHATKLMSEVVPHVELVLLEDMCRWPVADWSGCLDDDGSLVWEHEPYTPFPHQEQAITDVLDGFESYDRGKMILPCGTGKSVTAMWIAERMVGVGGTVLYLVPSIALMGQTMREWAANRGMPHRYVGVCSDTKAGRTSEDQSLAELTMPVTTDAEAIAAKLGSDPEALSVVFTTYQSLPKVAEAQKQAGTWFDLAICDEAHRTAGMEKDKDEGSAFLLIHDEAEVQANKRLYMTATPKVYTDKVKDQAAGRDFGVYSMDDSAVYGPDLRGEETGFHRLTFGKAVGEGLLADYQVVAIAVDKSVLSGSGDTDAFADTDLAQKDAVRFAGILDALADPETEGLSRAVHRATGTVNPLAAAKRAIAFNSTIRQSEQVEKYLPMVADRMFSKADPETRRKELIDLDVRHIDGKSDALIRAQSIQWLRDGATGNTGCLMLTNARCLTEGVDVPALDAIVFCSPRKSQIDVVQAVGRVMRQAPGKDIGYIVLPVQVEDGQSAADALDKSAFNEVWAVLRALRSHDERLDVVVNSADLAKAGDLPITVIDATEKGRREREEAERNGEDSDTGEQTRLFEIALYGKVASVLVDKVGDRQHWKRWGKRTAEIARTVEAEITKSRQTEWLADAWAEFARDIRDQIGTVEVGTEPTPTDGELAQMLAQHAITLPVFEALFKDSQFTDKNPICLALTDVLNKFIEWGLDVDGHCEPLTGFYKSVSDRLEGADTSEARIGVLLEVYESFFETAMPDIADKLGIVYTPVELVDFILRSADAVARQEFGRGLTDEDVHILDPFTGTGTFINRLITGTRSDGGPLIEDKDLLRKFAGAGDDTPPELHANELVLLAYYLAAIKIEEGYAARNPDGRYQAFQGIVWTDTFINADEYANPRIKGMRRNSRRAHRQNDQRIMAIVGNPPWSAGQKSASDDNPNNAYPVLLERVRNTYGSKNREITGKAASGFSASNLYIKAWRWASDRLDREQCGGIVGFVHPNSMAKGTALAGLRACMAEEFTDVWVVDLRGDAMTSGEEGRIEGDTIFTQGSRSGVQITLAVYNPTKARTGQRGSIHIARVPERSTRQEKFGWLREIRDVVSGINAFEVVPETASCDWVDITDGSYKQMLQVCSTNTSSVDAACQKHVSGVKTNCDAYVYSFSRSTLITKINKLINEYADTLEVWEADGCDPADLDLLTRNNSITAIKWTKHLKDSLRKRESIEFDESRIREVLYRPFVKLWLYEDHRILSHVKAVSSLFPKDEREGERESLVSSPCTTSIPAVLATDKLPDLKSAGIAEVGRFLPREAILLSGTSNMTFQALATTQITDLAAIAGSRQTRILPRVKQAEGGGGFVLASPNQRAIFGIIATNIPSDLSAAGPNQPTRYIPRRRS